MLIKVLEAHVGFKILFILKCQCFTFVLVCSLQMFTFCLRSSHKNKFAITQDVILNKGSDKKLNNNKIITKWIKRRKKQKYVHKFLLNKNISQKILNLVEDHQIVIAYKFLKWIKSYYSILKSQTQKNKSSLVIYNVPCQTAIKPTQVLQPNILN